MADQAPVDQVVDQQAVAEDTPEPTAVELEAREQGWIPKEEYDGDEHRWIPADEFVRRKPLFDKIEKQRRELDKLKESVGILADHNTKIKEHEYNRALATLRAQKKDAFLEGDADKIVTIDEQIDQVKDQQKQFTTQQAQAVKQEATAIHPEFEDWTNKNSWYVNNRPMKAFADEIGKELAAKGGRTPLQILQEVEKQVKAEFPTKFVNQNRQKPGAVEGAGKGNGRNSDTYTPSDMERRVAKKLVEAGAFKTEAEYYKDLQKLNGKS